VKKGSSITKNEYLCLSPRTKNAARLTSEEKKIKTKNKSTYKLPGSSTMRKSKGDFCSEISPQNVRLLKPSLNLLIYFTSIFFTINQFNAYLKNIHK
jgi:hypothetical protein